MRSDQEEGHFFIRQRMSCNAISQILLDFTYVIQNLILSSTKKNYQNRIYSF